MTTAANSAATRPIDSRAIRPQQVWRGLFWYEWFSHGSQMLFVLSVWLIGQWVLEIFYNTLWITAFGSLMGLWLGIVFAGGDALEGSEEFGLALPALRWQRYRVRLVISLGFLVALVGISLLAIGYSWPQALWSLFVETNLTKPFPSLSSNATDALPFYLMAIGCPLSVFGVTFGFAAMASSRDQVSLGGLLGVAYTAVGAVTGFFIEEWWYSGHEHHSTGLVAFALLLLMAAALLVAGYFGYSRKDGISRPRGLGTPQWRTTFIVSTGAILFLIGSLIVIAWVRANR